MYVSFFFQIPCLLMSKCGMSNVDSIGKSYKKISIAYMHSILRSSLVGMRMYLFYNFNVRGYARPTMCEIVLGGVVIPSNYMPLICFLDATAPHADGYLSMCNLLLLT